jgi:hypothetical protein
VFPPEEYVYQNIAGDFRGHFVRADLKLSGITGRIDVVNEYGHTQWTIDKPLPTAAHRVVTYGGQIDIRAAEKAFGNLPVLAVSECGTVRIGINDASFEDVSWTSSMPDGQRRGWRGFERKSPTADRDSFFERFDRIPSALAGEERSEGLDLISRGGTIQIMRTK